MNGLAQAVFTLVIAQPRIFFIYSFTSGPKVKELRTYNGDRSNKRLDDYIQDIMN
jgi:hypothetical protein